MSLPYRERMLLRNQLHSLRRLPHGTRLHEPKPIRERLVRRLLRRAGLLTKEAP